MARLQSGEILIAAILAAIGALWASVAAGMPMWEGFAPQSGFLPLVYGVLLSGLALAIIVVRLRAGPDADPAETQIRKPLVILAALAAGIGGIDFIGFAAAMFLVLAFLYCVVERLPPLAGLLASAATSAALILVFRTWLGVPMPVGPWSF
jgi:hypothetical protein